MTALRILIIEDEAIIAMLLADVLLAMGHVVCATVATEEAAIAAAIRHRPDLMIVDARLAAGNGVSAVEKILRVMPIPHVFMSGDVVTLREAKPDAVVIEKPFRDLDLARAMQRALAVKINP